MSQQGNNNPSSTTITDLANGTVNIDNAVNPQTAQRPINELSILALNLVDPSADYFDVYDASTWNHVRVPAMRPSQASYLADWLNDTRAGSLWTITSGIYAVHDHIHPVTKLSPFATPPTITFAWFTAPTWTVNLSYDTESGTEETINYFYQWSLTIPNAIAWRNFTISNVAWFRFKSRVTNLYRLSAMAWYPWTNTMEKGQACDKYGNSATTYLYNASTLPWNVVNISTFRVEVTYTLI